MISENKLSQELIESENLKSVCFIGDTSKNLDESVKAKVAIVSKHIDECVEVALENLKAMRESRFEVSQPLVFKPNLDLSVPMNTWSRFQVVHWLTTETKSRKDEITLLEDAKVDGHTLMSLDKDKLFSMGFKLSRAIVLTKTVRKWSCDH